MFTSAVEVGGELMNTTDVENFPGFPDGVLGPDLMTKLQQQAERFGTELVYDDVTELDLDGDVKHITTAYSGEFDALAVIISTGSAYRRLGLESEDRLAGRGISWCATCDGAFFKEQHIAVVGGGDSAMEEATFLTRFADRVTIIHRSDNFRASNIMLERARANEKIDWLPFKAVEEFIGEQTVSGLRLRDTQTGEESQLDVTGVFPHRPRARQARAHRQGRHRRRRPQLAHLGRRRVRRRRRHRRPLPAGNHRRRQRLHRRARRRGLHRGPARRAPRPRRRRRARRRGQLGRASTRIAEGEPMATNGTSANFQTEVLDSEQTVIVDFWAAWCGPCRQVAPVLDQLVEEHPNVKLVKVDVDTEQDLAMQYRVASIPAIKVFKGGEVKAEVVGARPKGVLEKDFAGLLD
jgi:thioredoxin reductase (NADPH)